MRRLESGACGAGNGGVSACGAGPRVGANAHNAMRQQEGIAEPSTIVSLWERGRGPRPCWQGTRVNIVLHVWLVVFVAAAVTGSAALAAIVGETVKQSQLGRAAALDSRMVSRVFECAVLDALPGPPCHRRPSGTRHGCGYASSQLLRTFKNKVERPGELFPKAPAGVHHLSTLCSGRSGTAVRGPQTADKLSFSPPQTYRHVWVDLTVLCFSHHPTSRL